MDAPFVSAGSFVLSSCSWKFDSEHQDLQHAGSTCPSETEIIGQYFESGKASMLLFPCSSTNLDL